MIRIIYANKFLLCDSHILLCFQTGILSIYNYFHNILITGEDSCTGDSGGPLMKMEAINGRSRYYILGIVSFGADPCGFSNAPAVYTRIASYLHWMLDNIEQ